MLGPFSPTPTPTQHILNHTRHARLTYHQGGEWVWEWKDGHAAAAAVASWGF